MMTKKNEQNVLNTIGISHETVASSALMESFFRSPEYVVLPGFCDVHVHFREPGFSYKETIRSGSMAAARGGYTAVCTMPNLKPVPDSLENLRLQTDIIDRDAIINVYPYGSITKMEMGIDLVDMEELAPHVVAFSDDGRGVQNEDMMREAILSGTDFNSVPELQKHAKWFGEFSDKYDFTFDNIDGIIKTEIGKTFVGVLRDAGVFKDNEQGRAFMKKFIASV